VHPDLGLLAAHAERRLSGAEATQLEAHLVACSSCYETFAETVQFLLAEETEEPVPEPAKPGKKVLPFYRRPAFQIAAGLAAAAGLFLAIQQPWRGRPQAGPLVAELAQAMGPTRFIEPRLTGGFQHGRLVVMRSGNATHGLDAQSPAVLTAVAHIRERTQNDTSPAALAALAATYLVSGDIPAAVKALESATAQEPENPKLQSDLAAAYLVRASRLDEPSDLPKALEAAEKSIERKDAPLEAWFNRALALEGLHLIDQAKKAWNDYLERDSTSAWAEEARKRRDELASTRQSTFEENQARTRAALDDGRAAIEALADDAPSLLSDYFLSELLPRWADAYLTGHPDATVLRTQAERAGEALLRTTGDALPRDAALALSLPASVGSRDPPRAQALGYKALREAQRLYDLGKPSCQPFRESHNLFKQGGSPFADWAHERVIVTCLLPAKGRAFLQELSHLEDAARRKQYGKILARALWIKALYYSDAGDFDRALQHYRLARDTFHALRDPEGEASVRIRLAYVLGISGDARGAWRERIRTLGLFDAYTRATRWEEALFLLAQAYWHDQHVRGAVPVLTELVDVTRDRGNAERLAIALLWRADVFHLLERHELAVADLAAARAILDVHGSIAAVAQLNAAADAAEGRILAMSEPDKALSRLRRAMPIYEEELPAYTPPLHLQLARILRAGGSDLEAEAELEKAISRIEAQRTLQTDAQQEVVYFDYAASMPFDEMVSLQIDARDDPLHALRYVERSRGRQVTASLLPQAEDGPGTKPSKARRDAAPIAPEFLQRRLTAGVALVYYVLLPDRVVAWVLDRDDARFFPLTVRPGELERRVATYDVALESGAPTSALREQSARLLDDLVRPLRPALEGHDSLVLIPDAFLRALSFASLWDRQTGRYLVEDYRVAQSPNGTAFALASAAASRASRAPSLHLLCVGNPRLPPGSGFAELRGARMEATEISRLYADSELLLDATATKRAFLAGLDHSDVVHFAGHATEGDAPGNEQLLLAADPETRAGGVLRADEIVSSHLRRARLVVLAGCRTATGSRSRLEGSLSVARPFLAAGVPMVVASLWDTDDDASRRFFLEFHRRFLAGGDAATAVRETQLTFLGGSDPILAHPSKWAGFVSLGGFRRTTPALTASEPRL